MNNWTEVEHSFRELFAREWYTNHGPLAKAFELALSKQLGTEHAVCVVNPAIALTMALEVLQLKGPVAVLGKETRHTRSALHWSQASVLEPQTLTAYPTPSAHQTPAAVLCNGTAPLGTARELAKECAIPLVLDCTAIHARDLQPLCKIGIPTQCDLLVLSFDRGQAIEAQGAACIATSNAELAEALRNIRSSYGTRATVSVVKTANGRMSEAQAALGLINLERWVMNGAEA